MQSLMHLLIHLVIYLVIDHVVRHLSRGEGGHAWWKRSSDDDVRDVGQGRSRGDEPNITWQVQELIAIILVDRTEHAHVLGDGLKASKIGFCNIT